MRIVACAQLSPEWWEARRGVPTASNFDKIMTPAKGQYSDAAEKYVAELIGDTAALHPEFLTERPCPTRDMEHGRMTEPEAREWYEFQNDLDVVQVGLCLTDDGRFGCSPDGLVGEDGGLELKCPQPATQALYLMKGVLPREYKCQVHGCLIVTGRAWWDFVSYCPGLPPLRIRVYPDDFTDKLRAALERFWGEYQLALKSILGDPSPVILTEGGPALTPEPDPGKLFRDLPAPPPTMPTH